MNVLGFDTATAAASACLLRADGEAFEVVPAPQRLTEPPAHARELMPALARVVDEAGLSWDEVDAVGVGVGPGTFTGLRIGVATARALAHARGLQLRPVSSLAALAEGIEGAERRLAVIDARRGEVFAALHDAAGPVWEPFTAAPEAVAQRARAAGPTPTAAGDGSVRFRQVLESAGVRVEPDDSAAHVVRGLHVCRLAVTTAPAPPEGIVPDYLRLPDAQPQP